MADSGTSPLVISPGPLLAGRPEMATKTSAMSTSVIIDARDRLRWHQRFACDASTAALWGGWLWLWVPLLKASGSLARLGADLPPWVPKLLLPAAGAGGLPLSLVALAGTSGTLMVWRKMPVRRATTGETLPVSEYARHFQVPVQMIEAGRGAATCVVHHDADGRIARIECRAPVAQG
jgi:poly-beta-1,6-N-acetyl-D-glucosamine biosynthesis protein PgaD